MLQILNCLVDDGKFVNDIVAALEYVKDKHIIHHVLITKKKKYSSRSTIKCRELIDLLHPSEVLDYIKRYDINAIIMHGINSFPISEIQIPHNIKVLWKAWGYDIYRFPTDYAPLVPLNLYKPLTRKIRSHNYKARLNRLKTHIYYLLHRRKISKAIARVDFFSGVLPEEYDLIKERNSFFKAKRLYYPYFNPEEELPPYGDLPLLGHNILCGNSAGESMNHVDILSKLNKIDIGSNKVIVPLSYGGNKDYVKRVKQYICNSSQNNVVVLDDFLPYEEYVQLMCSCGFAIYGNEQQAAVGNILLSVFAGQKVFLSKTSLMYKYLSVRGFVVFSIQDDLNKKELLCQLDDTSKLRNRKLFNTYFSNDMSKDSLKYVLYTLDK